MQEHEYERVDLPPIATKSKTLSYQTLFFWIAGMMAMLPFQLVINMD